MSNDALLEELAKNLPRKEDQLMLKRIFSAYEKGGEDAVKELLEEEIEKITGEYSEEMKETVTEEEPKKKFSVFKRVKE